MIEGMDDEYIPFVLFLDRTRENNNNKKTNWVSREFFQEIRLLCAGLGRRAFISSYLDQD